MTGFRDTRLLVRVTMFGAAVLATLAACLVTLPRRLPGAALGSPVVLRVEWATAVFAGLLLVTVVLIHAWRGVLPSEISGKGVDYAESGTDHAIDRTQEAVAALRADVSNLRREYAELASQRSRSSVGSR